MLLSQLIFGLKVTVIGMGVTFVGLVILIALVHANRLIAESVNKASAGKTKSDSHDNDNKKQIEIKPTAVCKAEPVSDKGNVVAAITGAISVVMQGTPFKVKSVKRVQNTSAANSWDIVAIQEQNNNL